MNWRRLFWTALTVLGVCVGFFSGLTIAPELSPAVRWAFGIGVVAVFAVSWVVNRRGPR
jgi:hypothetical protein